MSKSHNKIPKVRFKGETRIWHTSPLNDVTYINPSSEIPNEFEYVDLESVKGITLIGARKELKITAPSRAQRLAVNGDIFYQTVRPYQRNNFLFNLNKSNYVFSTGYAQLRCKKEINNGFIFSLLQTNKFVTEVLNKCTGTSYPSINTSDLSLIDICIPSIKEQTQIGFFFQKLDQLIELSQKRLEQTQTYKKAMLQKMFPQDGETVPKIRFKDFFQSWSKDLLGNHCDIRTGGKDVQDANKNGKYPFFIRSDEIKKINSFSFNGEAILIPGEGRLGEIFHYIKGKFDFHQRVYKISDFDELSGIFTLCYMQFFFKKHAMKYTVKATVDSLRLPIIKNFEILYPSLEEQTLIGNFFQKLDKQIEQYQNKLTHYQTLKKAMLQRMFV